MRRLCAISILLLIIIMPANSQSFGSDGSMLRRGLISGQSSENARLDLQVGTNFSSYSSGMSRFGSYISPHLQYQVNPALTIVAGGSFSFSQYNEPTSLLVQNSMSQGLNRPTDYSVYMSGSYKVNENLMMTGTVYNDQGNIPSILMNRGEVNNGLNPALTSYSSHGMSMGIQYRVSETVQFGARVGVNRTDNPYHLYSPFSTPSRSRRYGSMFHPY